MIMQERTKEVRIKRASRDVRLCRLNCTYSDEYNAPSMCIMRSGRIIVAYTGHAQDNLPVCWHEGSYSAHTGGWHCDTAMPVEYDD